MFKFEKRNSINPMFAIIVGILAVIIGLILNIILLNILGYDAIEIFSTSFGKTFVCKAGLQEATVTWVPIVLCALSTVVAAKVGLWNLGLEGQFYMGAFAATAVSMFVISDSPFIKLPLMFIAAFLLGGISGVIMGALRYYLNISDILSGILLNGIAFQFILLISSDVWKDESTGAIQTPMFDTASWIPIIIPASRVHLGVLIAIVLLVLSWFLFNKRPYGYEMRAVGQNIKAAIYAGMNVRNCVLITMLIAGGITGIAGMLEVSGVAHRLQIAIHNGYGFSGFVVAWIARLNIFATAVISFFFSGLQVAGFKMQMMGLSSSIVQMLQGSILILCISGELLLYYKVTFIKRCKETKMKLGKKREGEC